MYAFSIRSVRPLSSGASPDISFPHWVICCTLANCRRAPHCNVSLHESPQSIRQQYPAKETVIRVPVNNWCEASLRALGLKGAILNFHVIVIILIIVSRPGPFPTLPAKQNVNFILVVVWQKARGKYIRPKWYQRLRYVTLGLWLTADGIALEGLPNSQGPHLSGWLYSVGGHVADPPAQCLSPSCQWSGKLSCTQVTTRLLLPKI